MYSVLTRCHFSGLERKPLMATLAPKEEWLAEISFPSSTFGNVPKGSVLSYQQKLSQEYIINDYSGYSFPGLPLETAGSRYGNNVVTCLNQEKAVTLESLQIDREVSHDIETKTSLKVLVKFGLVAKRVSGFQRLVTAAMRRGIELDGRAAMVYASAAKENQVNLFPSGLIIDPINVLGWVAAQTERFTILLKP